MPTDQLRYPTNPFPLLLLSLALNLYSVAIQCHAQDDDEQFRPGLIARYVDIEGTQVARIDRSLSFDWKSSSPDDRLRLGEFTAQWTGYLMSQLPGEYRLHAHFAGAARIRLNGKTLIDADSMQAQWFSSNPVELPFDWHALEVEYETGPSRTRRLSLYWSGPKFQLEPIPPRHLYHDPQKSASDSFDRGASLARALRCEACHRALGASKNTLPGPALGKLGANIQHDWLIQWLAAPAQRQAAATAGDSRSGAPLSGDSLSGPTALRRMPKFDLARQDAEAIAAMLAAGGRRPPPNDQAPSGNRQKGEALFMTLGCLACHQVGELGESGIFAGGDLTNVANKRPARFFADWLTDPAKINPDHRMPIFDLARKERNDLSEYLSTLRVGQQKRGTKVLDDDSKLVARGRLLFHQFRCHSCHSTSTDPVEDSGSRKRVSLLSAKSDWAASCMDRPKPELCQPGYDLPVPDQRALRDYFAAMRRPSTPQAGPAWGELLLAENNCLSCHSRDGLPGLGPKLTAVAEHHADLASLLPAMTPPSLTSIGDKLRRPAIAEAIRRKGDPHRPYLKVRMPRFRLADDELTALEDYFVSKDRIADRPRATTDNRVSEAALQIAGARLVTTAGFGCSSCHQIGEAIPPKAPLNARGPDLSLLGNRVRRQWYERFVRNPARIVPRMEMPSVQLAVSGVLDEQLDDQLHAVWHVLNRPDFQPPRPDAVRIVSQARRPNESSRAFVLTDVVKTPKQTFIKPMVVGLNNRHNVLFDLQTAQLVGWWVGDVAHQQTEGKTWFWQPGGVNVIPLRIGSPELIALHKGDSLSPQLQGQFITEADYWRHRQGDLEFGYRLAYDQSSASDRQQFNNVVQIFRPILLNGPPADGEMQGPSAGTQPVGVRRTGFRREVRVGNLQADQQIMLRAITLDDSASATISSDRRQLDVSGTANVRISLVHPVDGRLSTDGTIMATPDQQGRVAFVLVYSTTMPVDAHLIETVELPDPQPVRLHVVPGYKATRLPLSSDVMPVALGWKPNGTLLIASLKGRVWSATDRDGDGLEDTLIELADDLAAPYGIAGHEDYVDVANKFALLRLFDHDGDGRADETRTVASGWGHSADYHDWAVGLPQDESGNYFLAIPCQQDERSVAAAKYRGTVMQLVKRHPTASDPRRFAIDILTGGHRFPMGIARNRNGELFVTDNQGNYNPFNELNHVVRGARYGFINALERKPGFDPVLTPPAINIPHPWTRSVNGICFLDTPADARRPARQGRFGPFEGHLLGAEYDTRRLVRMTLEQVNGTYQGAVYPFSCDQPIEGPPMLGPIACAVSPDGAVYVGNIRDSGWGGANNVGSIVRLTPQPELIPIGIAEVRAIADGLTIDFSGAVDRERAGDLTNYSVSSYTRISTPAYGGEDVDRRTDRIAGIRVSQDSKRVFLLLDKLRQGYVYEIRLKSLTEGQFFPSEAHYTMRSVPE